MKKILTIFTILTLSLVLTGCTDELENLSNEINDVKNEVNDVYSDIKDSSSESTDSSTETEKGSNVYPDSKDVVVTLDEYNQLSTGMTESEVWNIIGGQCTKTGTTDLGIGSEYITVSYGCNGSGTIGANAILMFQGGELKTMSQFGLK